MSNKHYEFTLLTQFISEFSFSNPEGLGNLHTHNQQPKVEVNMNVDASTESGNRFQSHLTTKFNAFRDVKIKDSEETEKQLLFTGYLTYSVLIHIPLGDGFDNENLEPEQKEAHNEKLMNTLMVEVPRLSFPYVRQFIGNVTLNAGFPPLLINPVDFERMYVENRN